MNGYILLQLILVVLCCYIPYCDAVAYGESCTTNGDCTGNGVVCLSSGENAGTCRCDTGYFTNGNNNGCIAEVGYGCQGNSDCSTGADCSGGSVCVCTSDWYANNGATTLGGICQPMVLCCNIPYCDAVAYGQPCDSSNDDCTGNGEVCPTSGENAGTCRCDTGYFTNDKNNGCNAAVGYSCQGDSDCSTGAVCSGSVCTCTSSYYDNNGATTVGGICQLKVNLGNTGCSRASGVTDSCSDTNAECGSSNVCQCKSAYYDDNGSQLEGSCRLKKDLGYTCDNVNQCSDSNTVCSTTCQCAATHYDDYSGIGGSCVLKKVVNCPSGLGPTASCSDGNAECSRIGSSSTYICQCKSSYYDANGSSGGGLCVPRVNLGSTCPMPDACSNTNSQCLGNICKCMDNFYDDNNDGQNGGNCRSRKPLYGLCNPSASRPVNIEQCYENAECTLSSNDYRCVCKSNSHVENIANCVFNIANGQTCTGTSSNECSDENAQCFSDKCTCGTNYYDDNNLPVGGTCRDVGDLKVSGMTFPSNDVTTTSLTVTWTAPSTIKLINNYKVSWFPNDNSQSPTEVDKSATSTTITGLYPGQTYTVTFTSVNTGTQAGVDRTISVVQTQATKPNQPGPLNTNDVNYSVDADNNNIYLVWMVPSSSQVTGYTVIMLDGTEQKATANPSNARGSLSFSSGVMKHGYIYRIEIVALSQTYGTNNNRESSSTFSTTIKTRVIAPGKPTNVQCGDATDSSISLSWTAPGLPNGDLVQYMIKVYPVTTLLFSHTVLTGNRNQEYTVPSLNPGSYYIFKVFTVNELFNSTSGQFSPSPYCATKAQSFSEPQNFSISGINSRGFTSTWSKPANIDSGELLGYVVQIKDRDSCLLEQIYKCTDCTGTFDFSSLTNQCSGNVQTMTDKSKSQLNEAHTFTTASLNPDIMYTVTVSAINSEGKGYMAEQTAKTLEEAPQKPFINAIGPITSTTLTVQWIINGPRPGVTTYTIIVEPEDTAATTVTSTVQGFTNTFYKVTGLEEFWTYTVKVKVATSIGEKTSVASNTLKTLAAAPGRVDAFTIETPDGDYTKLKVSWKTPTVLQRNGVIKEFKFTHNATELPDSTVEFGSPETFQIENKDTYVYEKTVVVQPEHIYIFEVYAVNEYNQQGYVTSEIKMAPAGVPQTPTNVDISEIKSTSVVVSWIIDGPRPGITTYTVMVNPLNTAAAAVTQQVHGFGNTSCTVIGLEEFWEYTAKVKMETPVGEKTSDVTPVFKTLSSSPGQVDAFTIKGPFNGDFTKMEISWKIPTLLNMNGVIKALKIVHNATRTSIIESEETSTFPARQEDFIYSIIVDVVPKRTYSFQVYAINAEDMTGEITKETIVAPSPETETPSSSNIAVIIAAVLGGVVLLLIVALVIFIVRYKRLKVKRIGRQNSKPQAKTEENARFDNLQEVSIPVSGDYANNYMELDDTSRLDTYDRINIGRPGVESSATDTEQYEIPDVPSQK